MEIEISRVPFVAGAGKYAKRLGQHGFVAVLSGAVGLSACMAQPTASDLANQEGAKARLFAKQGYPKEQSASMLDPEVRALLDVALRLYREPGLFSSRSKALEALGVHSTSRRWSDETPVPGSYRAYVDSFASEGIFARPGWQGEYSYSGKRQPWTEQWHAVIQIKVDYKKDCQNSRAVEGYLDLVLDPGLKGYPHPVTERLQRHEVPFARPSAKSLTPTTPSLILTFSRGCLAELVFAKIFELKEINDDNAKN